MSLTFGAALGNKVAATAATSINTLSTLTALAWVYVTTLTSGRGIVAKNDGSFDNSGWRLFLSGTSGNVQFKAKRATTTLSYITNDTPIALNTWTLIGATYDNGSGSPCAIYGGTLTALASLRTNGTATNGSGAPVSDSGNPLLIGNTGGSSASLQGRMGPVALFNRVLILGEIQSWQFAPRVLSGCLGFWRCGWNGTGTQPDWSGNANAGTVTGATQSDDPPLRRWFQAAPRPYAVAAAPGGPTIPYLEEYGFSPLVAAPAQELRLW